jgi:hypothetical protein
MKKKALYIIGEALLNEGAYVKTKVLQCTPIVIEGIECFWYKNTKDGFPDYVVSEMTTGGMSGNGFTLDEAIRQSTLNFSSPGKWDAALIKAKKIMQDNGIKYPLNPTKKYPGVK